jgi:hypothetical protein
MGVGRRATAPHHKYKLVTKCYTGHCTWADLYEWPKPGVFNLSDSAGHINNFSDSRGPQSYDIHVHIIGKSGRSVNLATNLYIMCRQLAGLFVVIFSKRPAGHGKGLRGPHVARGPLVEDPWPKRWWVHMWCGPCNVVIMFVTVSAHVMWTLKCEYVCHC